MKHVIRHNLDIDAARNVARQALESYAARLAEYSPRVTWPRDNRAEVGFSVKGVSLSGTVDVTPSSYELDLEVPFLPRMFKVGFWIK